MLRDMRLNQTNRPLDSVNFWEREGYLLLTPPYQRGDVWGPVRRVNLIRSLLLGIPIPSIIINDRSMTQWPNDDLRFAVIDGKQRLTTILMFLKSELAVPGEWVDLPGEVTFSEMPIVTQRKICNRPLAFSEGSLPTLEEEQLVFELVNFGGVPQGESD